MARDRKRAKQRQQRRPLRGASAAAPVEPTELHRADLPGSLEHASGDVDEFDAALIRGAGGSPAAADAAEVAEAEGERERERERAAVAAGVGVGGSGRGGNGDAGAVVVAEEPEEAEEHVVERHEPRRSLPARAVAFLRASWAELQRVQWPDRPQVSQATAVVLGFVVVAGIYLGAADWVAQKIVNLIL
jgi:preprotein translocase subunit SecE